MGEEEKSEEETEETTEEEGGEEETTAPTPPPRPPQRIVQIKTPLDRPEFDWFLTTFMKKMGLTDKTQSAIMLTNMLYDMGIDPYADLTEVQTAIEEMNAMIKGLPDTPTSERVKDTLGGILSAKTGRVILQRMPKVTGIDPMMDRFEKIMDKYMPMIMGMRMVAETMKGDYGGEGKRTTEIPENLRNEITALKEGLTGLKESIQTMRDTEKEKAFMSAVIEQTTTQITPEIRNLEAQIAELSKRVETPPAAPSTETTETLNNIREELQRVTDRLGEKAGASKITLDDVDSIVTVLGKIEKTFKREPSGEFDWRAATVSTVGEIGKEFIGAYRDIATASKQELGTPTVQTQAPAMEMQTVIKRQVQNYITQRLRAGATQMNLKEAAQTLGLTPQQVAWAYQTLMNEGWINVRTQPPTEKKVRGPEPKTEGETGEAAGEEAPFEPVET